MFCRNPELTVLCQYTEFQNQSVKMNTEDKHWETCTYTSFFKREPRTNSTLPMHRISKSISENKHRGINTGKRVSIPRSLSVSRELTVLCQYTEFQNQSVKINTEDKHWETCMYTSFFKREPRTNSTLPIHRISKSISENKHRG